MARASLLFMHALTQTSPITEGSYFMGRLRFDEPKTKPPGDILTTQLTNTREYVRGVGSSSRIIIFPYSWADPMDGSSLAQDNSYYHVPIVRKWFHVIWKYHAALFFLVFLIREVPDRYLISPIRRLTVPFDRLYWKSRYRLLIFAYYT